MFEFQNRATTHILDNCNCALWVDMGLGKTVSALTAFADLRNDFRAYRALVIGPLRVARKVWKDEIARWSHLNELDIAVAVGTEKQRIAAIQQGASLTAINRENVAWLESLFIQNRKQIRPWPWDMVILDEAQSFKSQSSQRFKSLRRLRRLFPRLVELTGTPAPNGYSDLWSQLYLLDRGERLGATESAYRARWFKQTGYEGYSWVIRDEQCKKEIQELVSDLVLTLRSADYLSLPPVHINTILVTLNARERKTYEALKKDFITETYNGTVVTAVNAAVCMGKLLQLANGAIYTGPDKQWETFHDHKLDALEEMLDGLEPPIMVAYNYQSDLHRICKRLSPWLTKRRWKGGVLRSDRSFDTFRNGGMHVGVLHPLSCGHGLNDLHLSGAENIVHFGLGPNLELYQQLNARLIGGHRAVGKNTTIHHILAEDTEDERMLRLLTAKGMTQDDLTRNTADIANRRLH